MAKFPALPLFTDAFISDTMHLDAMQTGAYLMLLMIAWRLPDCALPDDDKVLSRYARMTEKQWKVSKSAIMSFFQYDGKFYRQKRLTKEKKYLSGISQKNINAINARWRKNKETGNTNVSDTYIPNAYQTDTNPHPHLKKERKKEVCVKNTYSVEFENFIAAYPKNNGAKKPAFEKYQSAIKNGVNHETIIRGAEAYGAFANSEGTEQRYIKHAATWLNQRGWESDYSVQPKLFGSGSKAGFQQSKGKGELAREAANRALAELGVKSRI